ncbi:MAG: FG-GAP-like repeat-containing protein [Pseudomonadales bacterium]|nr:FG-GAP-like repeat-containing protein [Pseudomonadales bacterium]
MIPPNLLSCSGSNCILDPAPAPATITFPAADNTSDAVGTLAGHFSVSKSGSAEYSIPLYTPEGVAGVVPKLALQYRSDSGNGLLGKDWSLGALSVITRCAQTRSQEGQARAVDFSSADRFCLDGEKLVLVNPVDIYGADGVEYRTEIERFDKIVSYGGNSATGPSYFRVWHKDGSVSEYGNSSDSRLRTTNTKTAIKNVLWAQNRIEDANSYASTTVNNPVLYTYVPYDAAQPGLNNDIRIKAIAYAFANSANSPNAVIEFNYAVRPDVKYTTRQEAFLEHNQRLNSIDIKNRVNGALTTVRSYRLTYANVNGLANKTSKLASIQECSVTPNVCYPATQFTWSDATVDFAMTAGASIPKLASSSSDNQELQRYVPVDFNGDGKTDLITLSSNARAFSTYLSNGSTLLLAATLPQISQVIDAWIVTDFDQDGYPDILYTSNGSLYMFRNTLTNGQRSFSTSATQLIANLDMKTEPELDGSWFAPKGVFADINGDGLIDVLYNKAIFFMEKDAAKTNGPYKFGTPKIITLGNPTTIGTLNNQIKKAAFKDSLAASYGTLDLDSAKISGDFNGDGLPDFLVKVRAQGFGDLTNKGESFSVVLLNDGQGGLTYFATPFINANSYTTDYANRAVYIIDINNDGLADIVYASKTSNEGQVWEYALSTGKSLFVADGTKTLLQYDNSTSSYTDIIGMYDVNQDGLPDLVYHSFATYGDEVGVILNNGYAPIAGSVGRQTLAEGQVRAADVTQANFGNSFFMDLNGDGIPDLVDLTGKSWLGKNPSNAGYNKITKITNGLGEDINITYTPLTNPDVYTREFDAPTLSGYPTLDLFLPAMVVSKISASAPMDGNANYLRSTTYRYQGLKYQPAGRGSLGFHLTESTDEETGTLLQTTFRQDFPFTGMPSRTQTFVSGQVVPLEDSTYTYTQLPGIHGATAAPYVPVLTQTESIHRVAASDAASPTLTVSGELRMVVTTASNYDAYGNAGTVQTSTNANGLPHNTVTTNTWANDTANWRLGKLTQQVQEQVYGGSRITRTTSYTYDTSSGLLTSEIREPQGSSDVKLTTAYDYDAFGNVAKTTSTAAAGTRAVRVEYDPSGRYVNKTYNALEQLVSNVTQRDAYGQPETIVGLNGKVQSMRYGSLSRLRFSASNEGLATTTQYRLCTASGVTCPSGAVYRIQTSATDGALANHYADKLGRELRQEIKSFNGTLALTDITYDGAGHLKRQSLPYFSGNPVYWNENSYDNLGRLINVVDANGGVSTTQYAWHTSGTGTQGLSQTNKNPNNQTKITLTKSLGQVFKVVDNLAGTIDYTYDASGNLTSLKTNGVTTALTYDALGRRLSLNDPDQGIWTYQYNAFGDLTQQQDAANAKTTFSYDTLGRPTQRQDQKGGQIESDVRWTYGTKASANEVGLLTQEEDLSNGYLQLYAYDGRGRLLQTLTSLGQNGSDGDYAEYHTYDQFGRPFQSIDASGHGIQILYNNSGYRQQLREATNPSHVYYTANQADAFGQITSESLVGTQFQIAHTYDPKTGLPTKILANSAYGVPRTLLDLTLNFDAIGQLTARTRNIQAQNALPSKTLTETFTYDGLNRLTSAAATGFAAQTQSYDLAGNILSKSGVGNYHYGTGITTASHAGPHAVTSAGSATYSYDAVGNLTNGDGRSLTYNSFRKPTEIRKGSATTTFDYGPNRQHYKRVDVDGSNVTITLTVGNVEFIKEGAGQSATIKRYIGGVVIVTDSPTGREEHALLTDHLGSTVALAKANAVELEQLDYDAFGKRRSPWTLTELLQADSLQLSKLTTTGFTGHEMLDGVGLIHMKGRVYEPKLGRFLSADPYITEPSNTQNFNRYSYAYNNPLTLVDPSGFDVVTITGHYSPRGGIGATSYDYYGEAYNVSSVEWTSPGDGSDLLQADTLYMDANGNYRTTNELIKAGLMTVTVNENGTVTFTMVAVSSATPVNITIQTGELDPANGGGNTGGVMAQVGGSAGQGANFGVIEDDPVQAAIDYLLAGSAAFREMYEEFKKSGATIEFTTDVVSSFDHENNIVKWNPTAAHAIPDGVNSTSLILAHEMAHAVEYYKNPEAFLTAIEPRYNPLFPLAKIATPSWEEIRNLPFEQTVARQLGEPVRQEYFDADGRTVDSVLFSCHSGTGGC